MHTLPSHQALLFEPADGYLVFTCILIHFSWRSDVCLCRSISQFLDPIVLIHMTTHPPTDCDNSTNCVDYCKKMFAGNIISILLECVCAVISMQLSLRCVLCSCGAAVCISSPCSCHCGVLCNCGAGVFLA